MKSVLITGCCGFIGFHLAIRLLSQNINVIGIDSFSSSYDIKFKKIRHNILKKNKKYKLYKKDLSNINFLNIKKIDFIFHLAAEAGVRKSINNPLYYVEQNISNTIKIFEFARKHKIKKIFYASSSSVYGNNKSYPAREVHTLSKPLSVYGISKIATENIAYYYYKIFNINSLGFRFFTVYGPYGRPDMSIFIFFKSIFNKKKINLFNYGKNLRDFTFIDDVINYLDACLKKVKSKNNFFDVYNIGDEKSISVKELVKLIEKTTKNKAKISLKPKIKLDPEKSLAEMKKINKFIKNRYKTNFKDGIKKTSEWIFKNKKLFIS